MSRLQVALATVVLAGLAFSAPARAGGQYELFGASARGKGMAGAQTASTEDASAAFYNPAGLAELRGAQFFAAFTGNVDFTYVDLEKPLPEGDWRHPKQPENYFGLAVGGAAPLGGRINRVVIGVSAYAPRKHVLSVRTLDPSQPHFYFWEAQPDCFELMPAAAVRLTEFLKVGGGIRMGGGIRGPMTADLDPFLGRNTRREIDGELHYVIAPTGGIILGPFWGFRLGATARGPVQVPIDMPVDMGVAGTDAQVFMLVRANTNYTPPTASMGVSWSGFRDKLILSADLQYSAWSMANDPSMQFTMDASGQDLGTVGLDESLDIPQAGQERTNRPGFHDILVPRVGFEWRLFEDVVRFRGGAYLRPTPVPNQTSGSNYLDSTAYAVTGSVAVRIPDPFKLIAQPITLEASLQSITLTERQVRKAAADDPVGHYRFGGQVYEGAVGASYQF